VLSFSGGDLGCELLVCGDTPVQALGAQHANFDGHVRLADRNEAAGLRPNLPRKFV
jgi:hypothetical protein